MVGRNRADSILERMQSLVDRRAVLIVVDMVAAAAAVFGGVWIRFGDSAHEVWAELGLPSHWILAIAFSGLAFTSFATAGVYRREMYWDLRTELIDLIRGVILLGFVSLAFLFVFKLEDVSRIAIAISFGVLIAASISARLIVRSIARSHAERGEILRRWVIVGTVDRLQQLAEILATHSHVGAGIVGFVSEWPPQSESVKWLGGVHNLPEVLRQQVVDEVIISGIDDQKIIDAVLSVCAEQGKTVRLAMDSVAPAALRGRMEEYAGIPMWSILSTPGHSLELALKRLSDILGSGVGLVVLSPLMLATAVAIWLVDGRPVFYRQRRGGLHGREFEMFKFRTMVNGADTDRDQLLIMNERLGPVFKIANDPRITKLGRWLRKTSIDETPQLINVLMGQMSLVGPRPQPVEEVAQYDLWHRRRMSMRPGITGLWQIRARDNPSFDAWMDNDLEYIDRWTLGLDLWILLQTPGALTRFPGE